MPPVVVNPGVSLPQRAGDELVGSEQLERISLFASLKKMPSVEKFPGSVVLRRYEPGESIVRQGEEGWTAFYILTSSDVASLREGRLKELEEVRKTLAAEAAAAEGALLDARQRELSAELAEWRKRAEVSAAAEGGKRAVATVLIELNLAPKARRGGFWRRWFKPRAPAPLPEKTLPATIPNDGPADIPLATRRDAMYEGDLFGEMSCMVRAPRSATVVADETCYVLEMLRNILEQVRKDKKYQEQMDEVYRRRALGPQLRKLPVFDMLDDEQFEFVRSKTELVTFEDGQAIFDQGAPSDSFYVIRNGLVKVVKDLATSQARTLTYLGRGDFFGEAGVLLERPRSATCLAFGHADAGKGAWAVDLVRINLSRAELERICAAKPALKARFEAQIKLYDQRDRKPTVALPQSGAGEITTHPRFEELRLIEGQQLMLIDLDRCTRCGECMRACVNVHDDGASRLFLEGPRFGKYLVPNTCRKCLDPVCMIGCPVGSIVRGDDGEIEIKNWCIGCGKCAENCPYGSIHMNELVDLELEVKSESERVADGKYETREVTQRAVVCDLCSGTPSKEPACVYHCPHDAAIRIDARHEFPAR